MITSLVLLTLVAAVLAWLPRRLANASWPYRAPLLGALTWLAAGYAVVLAVVLAGTTLVVRWDTAHDLLCDAWQVCLDALRGQHGVPAQFGSLGGLVLFAAVTARLLLGTWMVSVVGVARRRRHVTVIGFVGRPSLVLGATVVPHPTPAAYLVPGRRPQTVITSGALDALDDEEVGAVLAHERAHRMGRHHLATAAANLLLRAFPWIGMYQLLHLQVHRLIEMRADELAVRTHRPIALARALVAMAGSPPPPVGALGAGGQHTAERLHRLLHPPKPLPMHARAAVGTGLSALPMVPLLVIAMELAVA